MLEEINKITKGEKEEFVDEGGEENMKDNKNEEFVEEVPTENTDIDVEKVEKSNNSEEFDNEDNQEAENNSEDNKENKEVESEKDDFKLKYEDLSVEFSNLKVFKDDLTSKFNALESEIKELREYKQTVENEKTKEEKEQVFNDYSLLLDEEDMQECKENMDKFSVDEIQKKLAIAHSIKSIAQAKKQKNNKEEAIPVENLKITNDSVEKETDKFAIK